GQSRRAGPIRAGVVHRAGEVHGGVAGTNRTGHGLRGVEATELQRVGIAESIEAVVAAERAAMAARDEFHAAHVARDVLQRHPEVRATDPALERIGLVLVPRRRRAVERRLVDRVIESMLDRLTEQALRQRRAASEGQRLRQPRLEVDRLVDLENRAGVVTLAAQIMSAPRVHQLAEAAIQARQQTRDIIEVLWRSEIGYDHEAELVKTRDGLVGQIGG